MRLTAIVCILSVTACGGSSAPVVAPEPHATREVYEAVLAYTSLEDPLRVAQTTHPLYADWVAWAGESFARGDPAGSDLRAVGLRLPLDGEWVAAPPIESESARAGYFERLPPSAEVRAFSEIWWNPGRTAAVVALSRIRCSRCGNSSSVFRVERRGAGWVVQPGGITVRE